MTDLSKIATTLLSQGPHKLESSPRLIRVLLGGTYIFRSTSCKLVWEHPWYPAYYFPLSALQDVAYLTNARPSPDSGYTLYDVRASPHTVATTTTNSPHGTPTRPSAAVLLNRGPLAQHYRLDHTLMTALLEEDDPVTGHPADPYRRIDTRRSSRRIEVQIDGVTVAESGWAMHLYETGLPVRYYLPTAAARWEYLRESEARTRTLCPYKGVAGYWDAVLGEGDVVRDVVWCYENARMESLAVQNMLCFYNEKVDIFLDGEKLERPKTHFA